MPSRSSHNDYAPSRSSGGRQAVQEILGTPPGWALRWGITAVWVAVLLFGIGAWLARYPDTVTAQVVIATPQPALRLAAPQSGRLQRLLIADNDTVQAGQLLAVLQNPARLEDVQLLRDWLGRDTLLEPPRPGLQLGRLQPSVADLRQAWASYAFFQSRSDWAQRLASLSAQQRYLAGLGETLAGKKQVLEEELSLAQANFERNQALAASGNVSELDKEQAQTAVLRLERELREVDAQRLRNALEAERLQALKIDLRQQWRSGLQERRLACEAVRETLRSELEAWEQQFLLKATMDGVASFGQPLSPGQYLEEGQLVMTVVPPSGRGEALARGYLPVQNAGRVAVGTPANLFLEAYPAQQYGALRAKVRRLSLIPQQEAYYIELDLVDGMETTYGRVLPFAQELPAQANIITEDRRLLARLFDQLRSLWENY